MRRDLILENDIYCQGIYNNFKLFYKNIALTPSCNNIAYIKHILIAVKCDNMVYVYSPKIIKENNTFKLNKLAMFETFNSDAYLKIKVYDKLYIIDSNVQIKLCECPKLT